MNILELPENILFEITINLNLESIQNLIITNSLFYNMFKMYEQNLYFWKLWIFRHFDDKITEINEIKKFIKNLIEIKYNPEVLKKLKFNLKNLINDNQIKYVKHNERMINYIDNPSEEVQLETVKKDGYAIEIIISKGIKPSKEVILAAIKSNGYAIKYIDNPSEEFQLEAVKTDGHAIEYINPRGVKPSKEVQLAAVNENGGAIRFINNPSKEVQLAAVMQNGYAIKYIISKGIKPSEEVQLAAVKQNKNAIEYIEDPSEKTINYIKNIINII